MGAEVGLARAEEGWALEGGVMEAEGGWAMEARAKRAMEAAGAGRAREAGAERAREAAERARVAAAGWAMAAMAGRAREAGAGKEKAARVVRVEEGMVEEDVGWAGKEVACSVASRRGWRLFSPDARQASTLSCSRMCPGPSGRPSGAHAHTFMLLGSTGIHLLGVV